MVAVVLLGAGASFGSKDTTPHQPPLGNGPDGLFDRLCERGGIASELPRELADLFRSSFEAGMAAYYEYADGDIMRFQRELAEYLASLQPGPQNVYRELIHRIRPNRVIYSTLNYDLLFEQAAAGAGLNCHYSALLSQGAIRLLKLHGSSNFWPDIPLGMVRGLTVKRSGHADIVAPIRPLDRDGTLHRCLHDDSFAPAIAMYAKGKRVMVSPDFVSEQQAQWAKAVESASRVFVSGVRVHPSDTHIWDVLAKCDAKIFYYGLGSDKGEFFEWVAQSKRRHAYYAEADFQKAAAAISRQLA